MVVISFKFIIIKDSIKAKVIINSDNLLYLLPNPIGKTTLDKYKAKQTENLEASIFLD